MKNKRNAIRTVGLLFALELLDDMVRRTQIGSDYVNSLTRQTVVEAIRRAKRRTVPKEIKPHRDQMPLLEVSQ
jgi:hypothetical protein